MDKTHIPPLVAMPDVPIYLGNISRSKLYELVASGDLTRIRIGRRAFISGESIAGFIDNLLSSGDAA